MSNRNADTVACYYCGNDVSAAAPGRLDECPKCSRYLHVCRMCVHYDPAETSKQCAEDDAEKVQDKQAANFCDYFSISDGAFDSAQIDAGTQARVQLDALFGDTGSENAGQAGGDSHTDDLLQDAEALFRK